MRNLLLEKLLTLYYSLFSGVHDSIHEIPAYNWDKICSGDNLLLLIKSKNNRKRIENNEKRKSKWLSSGVLEESYEKIFNEFIQEFPPEKYYEHIEAKKEIALMRYRAIRYDKRHLNTLATLKEMELESKGDKSALPDFMKNIALIEQRIKNKIEYLKISLFEYNNYLRVLSK